MKIIDINGRNTLVSIDKDDIINNVLYVPDSVDQVALETTEAKGLMKRNIKESAYPSLEEIVLPKRTKSIANYGLAYLSSLSQINLDNIEFIGRCAFNNDIKLNKASFNNLKVLRKSAFDGSSIHNLYFKNISDIYVIDGLKKTKFSTMMPTMLVMINGKNKKTCVQTDQVKKEDYTLLSMLAKAGFKFSSNDLLAQRFYQAYATLLKLLKSLKRCTIQGINNIYLDKKVVELKELYTQIIDNNSDLLELSYFWELDLQIKEEFDKLDNVIKRKYIL